LFYNLLFRAASETLLEIATDPRPLGARIGVLAVLHTWSQNLRHHPHLHCLVPAGGRAFDNSRWVATRRGFFLPVRVLSRMFRGKLLAFLKQSYRRKQLCFPGTLAALSQPRAFHSLLHTLRRREWVVYSKPPFGGPEHVLKYLARYTHCRVSRVNVCTTTSRMVGYTARPLLTLWRKSRGPTAFDSQARGRQDCGRQSAAHVGRRKSVGREGAGVCRRASETLHAAGMSG
jgi:Putative transposase